MASVPILDVEACAYLWWLSRRPTQFSESDHLDNPRINTYSEAEGDLAEAVAYALRETQP